MISERQFARGFVRFWARTLPGLTEQRFQHDLVHGEGPFKVVQWSPRMRALAPARFNDLVSEMAFSAFERWGDSSSVFHEHGHITEADVERALDIMSIIRGERLDQSLVTDGMRTDAECLSHRLIQFILSSPKPVRIHPRLRGVGKLASVHADVLAGSTLIEVKASNRVFRYADVKQVLIYAFLAIENDVEVSAVQLVNPRLGISATTSLGAFFNHYRACSSSRFFRDMREELLSAR